MKDKKIILLAMKGPTTQVIYNALNKEFGIEHAILEEREHAGVFLKRRIRKLGLFRVAGQLIFQLIAVKILNILSRKRLNEIWNDNHFDFSQIPKERVSQVYSVNGESTIHILKELNPDLVVVHGTRIISSKVLRSISCPFINAHAGITPKYRGVHGAYWALTQNDLSNCGVTVHFVDAGIDTGDIILQENIQIKKTDNFVTYPWIQLAKSIELFKKAIIAIQNNKVEAFSGRAESRLWFHPTIWQYLHYRWIKGVK